LKTEFILELVQSIHELEKINETLKANLMQGLERENDLKQKIVKLEIELKKVIKC